MQRATVFGDIHANLPALESVLAHMDAQGHENLYCLGDLVGYGIFPDEVIRIIRDRGIPTIMGNYDQGVGQDSDDCGCAYRSAEAEALGKQSIAWTNAHTSSQNKQFLCELLPHIRISVGRFRVLLVHGSPRRINEYLYADRPDRSFEKLLDDNDVDVIVCGHTHLPYHKILASGRHIVNAGSVGKPKDDNPRACYVLLSDDAGQFRVEFVRVNYDVERAARAIEASDMPHAFADMLRNGAG